ncbi:MAG: DUF3108 domain-containing protein [Rhizobiales bacterium]|nr:DUF3108 domain-containing protein [Hyphomicrobiales bacterium]
MRYKCQSKCKNKYLSVIIIAAYLALNASISYATNIDAEYQLNIHGVKLGSVGLVARLKNKSYSIAIRAFTDGFIDRMLKFTIETRARGVYNGHKINSTEYMTAYSNKRIKRRVVVKYPNNSRASVNATPPYVDYKDTIPLRAKHLRNVVDPLGAMLLPFNKKYANNAGQQCNRIQPIFDGVTRYKLVMSAIKNTRKNDKSLKDAVSCLVRYYPIAGHRKGQSDRTIIDNYASAKVWLLPIENANSLLPVHVEIPTKFGSFEIKATKIKVDGKKLVLNN